VSNSFPWEVYVPIHGFNFVNSNDVRILALDRAVKQLQHDLGDQLNSWRHYIADYKLEYNGLTPEYYIVGFRRQGLQKKYQLWFELQGVPAETRYNHEKIPKDTQG